MDTVQTGGCFCGAVEIEVTGQPVEMGYCHCASCRSYSGSPVTAFTLWRDENVKVTRGKDVLGSYNKTGMSNRQFCSRCGGHIMTSHPGFGFTDIHAPALPGVAFMPMLHLNYAETVLPIRDGLPKLRDFPQAAGGTGEMIEE